VPSSDYEVPAMPLEIIVFVVICIGLFLYLLYALLNPEKF